MTAPSVSTLKNKTYVKHGEVEVQFGHLSGRVVAWVDGKVIVLAEGTFEEPTPARDDLSWLDGHDGSGVLDRIQHEAGHPSPAASQIHPDTSTYEDSP